MVQGIPNQQQLNEEKKSESFQVQVSVSDLRIRKRALNTAPSAGMIAKECTITETVEADGHTWRASGIWTRLDRP